MNESPIMETIALRHDTAKIKRVAKMMKVVSHPSRLMIIDLLLEKGRLSVKEIYNSIEVQGSGDPKNMSQSNASQHLKALEDIEVLSSQRDGKNIYYQIENHMISKLLTCVNECATC